MTAISWIVGGLAVALAAIVYVAGSELIDDDDTLRRKNLAD